MENRCELNNELDCAWWDFGISSNLRFASEGLLGLVEREVVLKFYRRHEHGISRGWVARMRESMERFTPQFSLNPDFVGVGLYAEGQNSSASERHAMTRGERLVDSVNGFVYRAGISASRAAANSTPRLIPGHRGAFFADGSSVHFLARLAIVAMTRYICKTFQSLGFRRCGSVLRNWGQKR